MINLLSLSDRIPKLQPVKIPEKSAVHLASKYGYRMLPLKIGTKEPFWQNFPEKATRDKAELLKLSSGGFPYNFGISLLKFEEGKHLIVVDIDRKKGKDGLEVVRRLESEKKFLPPTYMQRTASGGFHLVYWHDKPVDSNLKWAKEGLEILAGRRQIVAAGSRINGVSYEVLDDRNPERAPNWLIELLVTEPERKESNSAKIIPDLNLDYAKERGSLWIKSADPAIEGRAGDRTTFSVAAKLKDLGVDEDSCFELMANHWNSRCEPPWSMEELRKKVQNAYAYGANVQGCDAPEAQFQPVPEEPLPKWLEEDNKEFAIVNEGGTMLVYRFKYDHELGHSEIEKRTFEAHRQWGRGKRVADKLNRATAWLDHPKHREYDGVAFLPGGTLPTNILNLWQGFNVVPKQGDWSRIKKHIKDVICRNEPALEAYVIGWLARMVQHPGEQGEVALILRGGRGVGKGIFAGFFRKIFGRHSLHLAKSKHLTGNFNSHLRSVVFVFMDEAFFAGDASHESSLKTLITEPTFVAEAKYRDALTVRNCTHVLAASNDGWVIPAGHDERRFCVVDCSDKYQGDPKYFLALKAEAENGGIEAMLYDLLNYELSDFDVRAVPQTEALADQKLRTLKGTAAWLLECLEHESIGSVNWSEGKCLIEKQRAYEEYQRFSQARRTEYRTDDVGVWGKVVKQILGETLLEFRKSSESGRPRVWAFDELSKCKKAFDKYYRIDSSHWSMEDLADELFS